MGELKPTLKSEEIPESQEGDVVTLVGKNFVDEVYNKEHATLVEFYAPWCGHCKQLAPVWEELATKLKDNKKIVMAKRDSTANELEDVSISGFPTLKFWPAGATEPE